ncbi:MAG: OmpA family protein [Azonexaceae bacterium]|nr:OmpA family protein [Azonexaceae bacterium]
MSDQGDNETQGVVFGVLAFVVGGVIALVIGLAVWASGASSAPAEPAAVVVEVEEVDIVPVGDALAKVYFTVGSAVLASEDRVIILRTVEALAARAGEGVVLLSGFHDASGDATVNAELARQRALAVREALVAGGVPVERIKLRKPESTLGTGTAEEGRRVEVRVQ